MSRANPFGDLNDFTPQPAPKPVPAAAIDEIAEASGFPSRKAWTEKGEVEKTDAKPAASAESTARVRAPRRRTTGRNKQINIKATESTIERLYRVADSLDLPLGAVLEQALDALEQKNCNNISTDG